MLGRIEIEISKAFGSGAEVLAIRKYNDVSFHVLYNHPSKGYVVHLANVELGGLHNGSYCGDNREEAEAIFLERAFNIDKEA